MTEVSVNARAYRALLSLPTQGSTIGKIDSDISEIVDDPFGLRKIFTKKEDPEERLFDLKGRFKIAISQVSMHMPRMWREQLFKQLESLLDPDEWDFFDQPPSDASFSTFLRLLLDLKPQRLPGLGIANDGIMVAAWTAGKNRLTIECLSNDQVRLMVTRINEDIVERAVIESVVERVNTVLESYMPDVWFNNG